MLPIKSQITLDPFMHSRVHNITPIGVYFPGIHDMTEYSDACLLKLNNLTYSVTGINTEAPSFIKVAN